MGRTRSVSSAVLERARPASVSASTSDNGLTGALIGILGCLGACLLSYVGGAGLVQQAFPLVAAAVAVVLLVRRRWYSYFSYTLVIWLLSAEVRRFADWQSTYHDQSLIS